MKKKAFAELKSRQGNRFWKRQLKNSRKLSKTLRLSLENPEAIQAAVKIWKAQYGTPNTVYESFKVGPNISAFVDRIVSRHLPDNWEAHLTQFLSDPYKHDGLRRGRRLTRSERKQAALKIQRDLMGYRVVVTLGQIAQVIKGFCPYKAFEGKENDIIRIDPSLPKPWLRNLTSMCSTMIKHLTGYPVWTLGALYHSHSCGPFYELSTSLTIERMFEKANRLQLAQRCTEVAQKNLK